MNQVYASRIARRRNKRAGLNISLSTVIDLVLVTLALLVLYTIYVMLVRVMNGNPENDTATKNNFQELASQMNSMQDGQTKEVPVFIDQKWFVVGFKKEDGLINPQCGQKDKIMKRPSGCIGPCVCLCTLANSCEPRSDCKSIPADPKGKAGCDIALVMGSDKVQKVEITKQKEYISLGLKQ
jgi:hypothetical protein